MIPILCYNYPGQQLLFFKISGRKKNILGVGLSKWMKISMKDLLEEGAWFWKNNKFGVSWTDSINIMAKNEHKIGSK